MRLLLDQLPNFPKAHCRNADPDLFHGDDKVEQPDPVAAKHCFLCVHTADCLAWALDHKERGTWGGTTYFQRAALLRVRHRVRCPGCKSYDIFENVRTEVCMSCGLSWLI